MNAKVTMNIKETSEKVTKFVNKPKLHHLSVLNFSCGSPFMI